MSEEYKVALGLCTYSFAYLESMVINYFEKLEPGITNRIKRKRHTAGQVARKFNNRVKRLPESDEADELKQLAQMFEDLVNEKRNSIFHAKPHTNIDGQQRLYNENSIEIEDLQNAADSFATCVIGLSKLYDTHRRLG
ncbi:hypothetical protein AB4456_23845 [Vibrio splendidus]